MDTNQTKLQSFIGKRIYWKSFFKRGFINYFSLSDGFGSIDVNKPNVSRDSENGN